MKVTGFTSLRTYSFVIMAAILGCCILPVGCVAENDDDESDPIIIVSSVFTPNGDGENEFFEVISKNAGDVVSLEIFTRAGVLIFRIEAERCIWDGCSLSGQPMAAGTYHYTAEILDSQPKISKCGFVHLYR